MANLRKNPIDLTNKSEKPPSTEIDFKLAGYRLRERRLDLGMTTQQIADTAGVARFTVVRLEKGLPCHRKTLDKIRGAVHIFTDQLQRPIEQDLNCAVHRAAKESWSVAKRKVTYQRQVDHDDPIHVNDGDERKRLGILALQPFFTSILGSELPGGTTLQALMELHQASWVDSHFGEEFVYVLRGPVTITVEGSAYRLETGDAITFDAHRPHQYEPSEPIGPKDPPALILLVVTREKKKRKRM